MLCRPHLRHRPRVRGRRRRRAGDVRALRRRRAGVLRGRRLHGRGPRVYGSRRWPRRHVCPVRRRRPGVLRGQHVWRLGLLRSGHESVCRERWHVRLGRDVCGRRVPDLRRSRPGVLRRQHVQWRRLLRRHDLRTVRRRDRDRSGLPRWHPDDVRRQRSGLLRRFVVHGRRLLRQRHVPRRRHDVRHGDDVHRRLVRHDGRHAVRRLGPGVLSHGRRWLRRSVHRGRSHVRRDGRRRRRHHDVRDVRRSGPAVLRRSGVWQRWLLRQRHVCRHGLGLRERPGHLLRGQLHGRCVRVERTGVLRWRPGLPGSVLDLRRHDLRSVWWCRPAVLWSLVPPALHLPGRRWRRRLHVSGARRVSGEGLSAPLPAPSESDAGPLSPPSRRDAPRAARPQCRLSGARS